VVSTQSTTRYCIRLFFFFFFFFLEIACYLGKQKFWQMDQKKNQIAKQDRKTRSIKENITDVVNANECRL
jgi:cell division protein FtsB